MTIYSGGWSIQIYYIYFIEVHLPKLQYKNLYYEFMFYIENPKDLLAKCTT